MILDRIFTIGNMVVDGCIKSKADIDTSVFMLIFMWSQLRSKDPNTKVGAAIYDYSDGNIYLGYNGFPSSMPDKYDIWCNRNMDEDNKYRYVVHAEANAMRKAATSGADMKNSTLYITHSPCNACIKDFIEPFGIKDVCYLVDKHKSDMGFLINSSVEFREFVFDETNQLHETLRDMKLYL